MTQWLSDRRGDHKNDQSDDEKSNKGVQATITNAMPR